MEFVWSMTTVLLGILCVFLYSYILQMKGKQNLVQKKSQIERIFESEAIPDGPDRLIVTTHTTQAVLRGATVDRIQLNIGSQWTLLTYDDAKRLAKSLEDWAKTV